MNLLIFSLKTSWEGKKATFAIVSPFYSAPQSTSLLWGGGGGGGGASFLSMPMENTGCHLDNNYANILIFANANVA